jgi:hypothetical protein
VIEVINFKKHQHPHHTEAESVLPEYSIGCDVTVNSPLSNGYTPSDLLIPDSLIPDSSNTDSKPFAGGADAPPVAPKRKKVNGQHSTAGIWLSYSEAYRNRYGVVPVRNAAVNGKLAQFAKRLPEEEAPQVAAFYLTHNKGLYVSAHHCVDLLLRDSEALRTEWATGRTVTQTQATQKDKTQTNANVWGPMIAEAEERERKERGE